MLKTWLEVKYCFYHLICYEQSKMCWGVFIFLIPPSQLLVAKVNWYLWNTFNYSWKIFRKILKNSCFKFSFFVFQPLKRKISRGGEVKIWRGAESTPHPYKSLCTYLCVRRTQSPRTVPGYRTLRINIAQSIKQRIASSVPSQNIGYINYSCINQYYEYSTINIINKH